MFSVSAPFVGGSLGRDKQNLKRKPPGESVFERSSVFRCPGVVVLVVGSRAPQSSRRCSSDDVKIGHLPYSRCVGVVVKGELAEVDVDSRRSSYIRSISLCDLQQFGHRA